MGFVVVLLNNLSRPSRQSDPHSIQLVAVMHQFIICQQPIKLKQEEEEEEDVMMPICRHYARDSDVENMEESTM